jgi:predicted HTH domain antitoxin
MSLTIEIAKEHEETLRAAFGTSLAQATKEALALEGYRQGKLSAGEVQDLLDLSTRHEAEQFLADRGVPMAYSQADLDQDRQTLSRLLGIRL